MNVLRCVSLLALWALSTVAMAQTCPAGNPRVAPDSRYTIDSTNGVVTDLATGLMWKRCSEGQSGASCGTGSATFLSWSSALVLANTSNHASFTDWRLPNREELRSLLETACFSPSINTVAFPAAVAGSYWSSTTFAPDASFAWNVNFGDGNIIAINKNVGLRVRLVRGGQWLDPFASEADSVPDAFTLAPQVGVPLASERTSDPVTVAGLTTVTGIGVSGAAGSTYSINSGPFTAVPGSVANGDQVRVRHTSAATAGTSITTILAIGSVTGNFVSTTTTAVAPTIGYNPTTGTTVGFTGVTTIGTTGTGTIAATPSGGIGTGAAATTTISGCTLGGSNPGSFAIPTPINLSFMGNTTTPATIGLTCTSQSTAQSATLTCDETRGSDAPVSRSWPLSCPVGAAVAPNIGYNPSTGSTVGFTGVTTIGTTGTGTIAATPSGGIGTGAAATTTISGCTLGGSNPGSFAIPTLINLSFMGNTTTPATIGLTCTSQATAQSATLTCNETRGTAPAVPREWPLNCPAGTPVAPTIGYNPTTGTTVGFTGVTTVGTTGNGTIAATPSGGIGTGAGATTRINGCTLGGSNPGSFAGATAINLSFMGSTTTPATIGLTCTSQATAQTATLTCNETRGTAPAVPREWPLNCPAGTPVAPTIGYSPTTGTTVGFTGVTTIGTTGNGTIAATPSGGIGTGAGATTTINGCTLGGSNPGSFADAAAINLSFMGNTTTPATIGLTCTSQATAQSATLTCNETRGTAPAVSRSWTLSCPVGAAVAPTIAYNPTTGTTVGFTGVTTIGTTGNGTIAATPSGGIGTGAAATTTINGCTLGGSNPGSFAIPTPINLSFMGNTTTPATIGLTCTSQATAQSATLTCNETRGTAPAVPREWPLNCPVGAAVAPTIGYNPTTGTTVGFTGVTTIGTTGTGTIAATPSGGIGTGAAATTTISGCTLGGSNPGSFAIPTPINLSFMGNTTTPATIGLTCTSQSTAQSATLTCNETRGGDAPVSRSWTLNCPVGAAVAPTIGYNPTTGSTVGFTGVTTIGTTGTGTIAATPSGGIGTGAGATTTINGCTLGGSNPGSFAGATPINLSFMGNTTTPATIGLTCTSQATAQTATLTCNETRGTAPAVPREWPLNCPAGTPVAPTIGYSPTTGTTVGFTGVTTIGTTGNGTIAATPSGGIGTGAAATTTINGCTLGGANAASFAIPTPINLSFMGNTTTPATIGLTCTSQATAQSATLTCNETRGTAPAVSRSWTLSCPVGAAVAPTIAYNPTTGTTVGFTGVTTIGTTGNGTIAATPSSGIGTGAGATTTINGCTLGGSNPGSFAIPTPINLSFMGNTTTPATIGLTCTSQATAQSATLTCNETRGTAPAVSRSWPLNCPVGAAVAPTIAYNPTTGTTVGFTGVTTIGTTGTGTIAATPSGGIGTGAGATTRINGCTLGGSNPGSFAGATAINLSFMGSTTTPATIGLTCTSQATAQTATLTCNETRGTAPAVSRSWPLNCPVGAAVAPTIGYSPTTGTTVGFTGVTTIGTTGNGTIAATPSGGIGTGAAATTTINGCTLGGANAASFAIPTPINLSFMGNTTTPATIGLTCTSQATAQSATLTCNETRGTAPAVPREWPLNCPAGTPVAPTIGYSPTTGTTVGFTGVTTVGTTGTGTIAATPSGGIGTGAGATTTINGCTLGGSNPGSFADAAAINLSFMGNTTTPATIGLTCTSQSTAQSATLTCDETRGSDAPVSRSWTLNCPVGAAVAPTIGYSPSTGSTVGFTGVTTIGTTGTGTIAATPSGGIGTGAAATTTISGCTLGGSNPGSFAIPTPINLSFMGNTTTPATIGLTCTSQSTAQSATLTCNETRGSDAPVSRSWPLNCPVGAAVAPTIAYNPTTGSTVGFTGVTTIGTTGTGTIAATPSGGIGTGAAATTTINGCTLGGSNPGSFGGAAAINLSFMGNTTTPATIGLTCTSQSTAQSATLTCDETRGSDAPVSRSWTLNCPVGAAVAPTIGYSPSTGSTVGFTGVTTIGTTGTGTIAATPSGGIGTGAAATTTLNGCTLGGSNPGSFAIPTLINLSFMGNTTTPATIGLTCTSQSTAQSATLTCNETRGSDAPVSRSWTLNCPVGAAVAPTIGYSPSTGSTVGFTGVTTIGTTGTGTIAATPSGGIGTGAAATTTLNGCTLGGSNPGSFAIPTLINLSFMGNTTTPATIGLTCTSQSTAQSATLTCDETRGSDAPVSRSWPLNCPVGAAVAPTIGYNPSTGSTVGFTGVTTIGTTGTGTIAATPSGGIGTGAAATTTINGCTLGGANAASFAIPTPINLSFMGSTTTPANIGLTCTSQSTAQSATLTCDETRGSDAPVSRSWPLNCPVGAAVAPTIGYNPTTGTTVSFTGVTTVGTTGNGTIAATPSSGIGTGAGATTTINGCTLGGTNASAFAGAAAINLSFMGNTTTAQSLALTCTAGGAVQTATLTCNETRGSAPAVAREWPLNCPSGQQLTTTTITADLPDPSVVGEAYPVTVEVRGQTLSPLGTVSISDDTGASCGPITLTAGTAPNSTGSCNLTSTSAGAKTLTASYTPASTAFAASDDTEAHLVNAAATTLVLLGPARSRITTVATYTAEISVTAPGAGTPAGTVTVSAGANSCTITLPTATPSCGISYTTLGSRAVSAVFAPSNSNFSGSTATPVQTLVFASADLSVTKTNGVDTYRIGDLLVYTVQVRNQGPDAAPQVRIRDVAPAGLTNVAWTCAASGGAICPDAGGTGTLDHVVATLPSSGGLTYTYFGNVLGRSLSIVNVAEVTMPADTTIEDPNPANNSATDTDWLDDVFADGFEAPGINAASGGFRLPGASLRSALDDVARVTYRLSDVRGEALRVYARVVGGELQVALAVRGADGNLRLGAWASTSGEPALSWTASDVAGGWVLVSAELR